MKPKITLRSSLLGGTLLLAASSSLQAAIRTWDNGNNDSLWGEPINWDGDATIPGAADTAILGTVGVGDIDLGAATRTVAGLTVNSAGYALYNGTLDCDLLSILPGASLEVDFVGLASPTDLIDAGCALTLGGGTLALLGKLDEASSQTFASTTLTANTAAKISLSATGTGSMSVDLNAIIRNAASLLSFSTVPDGATLVAETTTPNANGILGPWATVGTGANLQYAAENGSGQIVALGNTGTTAATVASAGLANVTSATTNYQLTGADTIPGTGAALTGNTLRYTGGAGTLNMGTDVAADNALTLNGIMQAGTAILTIDHTGSVNINNPTGGLKIGSGNELVITANNQDINIYAAIHDGGGAGSVTYRGENTSNKLSLGKEGAGAFGWGYSTYSGGTNIVSGRVLVNGDKEKNTVFGTGTVTMNAGTFLDLGRAKFPNSFNLTNAVIDTGNSFGSTFNGPLVVNGTVTLINTTGTSGNIDYLGDISGPGSIVSKGRRETNNLAVELAGINTFDGPAIINPNANMGFRSRNSLPDTGAWTADNLIVNEGGIAYFFTGGSGTPFTTADIDILKTLGTTDSGFLDGSFLGFWTSGNTIYTNVIADTNGGTNKLGVAKQNSNTLTLGDSNTYSGATILRKGTLVVTSLNSVVGGTVSSSLGTPTTVDDGRIIMAGSNTAPTLQYVGTGETTDRVIWLETKGGATDYTIEQAGTGLLKFTSAMSHTAAFAVILAGSTAGEGEFAGAIAGSVAGKVTKTGSGKWTLSGTNAYTGVTTVSAGTLLINGNNSAATGAVAVNGTSTFGGTGSVGGAVTFSSGTKASFTVTSTGGGANTTPMTITGVMTYNATEVHLNLPAGLPNGTYILASSSATPVLNGSFPAPVVDSGSYGTGGSGAISFAGNDLVLTVSGVSAGSAYATWAATNAPTGDPDDDYDGDGVINAVEFVLGGLATTNELGKLPTVATSGGNMTFSFIRKQSSIDPGKTTVTIEVGNDMVTWTTPPSPYSVPDTASAGPPVAVVDNLDGTDTVTLTVAQAPDARKFARMKVVITP